MPSFSFSSRLSTAHHGVRAIYNNNNNNNNNNADNKRRKNVTTTMMMKKNNSNDFDSTRRDALVYGAAFLFSSFSSPEKTEAKLQGRTGGIPIDDFKTLPGTTIKYYDIKGVGGSDASVSLPKGTRVAVHYDLKFRSLTIASSRVGAGVTGGIPYGFNVGLPSGSPGGAFLPAFNYGIQGMGIGTVRRMLVPAEYAYGKYQVQEIPPNSEVTLDLELLSIAKK